ncbi:Gustatory receptor family protein [Dirofilaria immitis]
MPSKTEKLLGDPLLLVSSNKPFLTLEANLNEDRNNCKRDSIISAISGVSLFSSNISAGSRRSYHKIDVMMNQQYEIILTPLFIYMRVLGLTSYTDDPAWKYPLMIYNIIIMIIMNSYSAFLITEIKFTGLDVNFAFAVVHACYLASGGICSLFLFWMRKSFNRLVKIVIQQIATYDLNFEHALQLHRMCKIMVGLIIFWAIIAVIITAAIHKKIIKDENNNLWNIMLMIIHHYVAFLTQSALMSWSVFFAFPCYILAVCLDAFIDDMHHDGIVKGHKWTNSEAINHVMKYKHRYRSLKKTADIIEEQFKYAIAYVDALCFTELCFILYTYLQDKSDSKTWIDTILCVLYATSSLFHMTFFTAPAYRLYERNHVTVATAINMFQNELTQNRDQFLDLISLVLTYVAIMLQFGHIPSSCLVQSTTRMNTSMIFASL